MGIHGSSTCSMALGGKGKCIGTLLGQENKGLAAMFVMMNEERLMVGAQAMSCMSSSYLHALEFARTRVQGAKIGSKDPTSVAILQHPDVRRMLLTMKAYVEGARSLLYYISHCEDQKHLGENEDEKEKFQNLIDVLIPVAKGYVSDRAVEMCGIGIQVFGGYGYTADYPVEQLMRDVRITPIYEGTNGIQAMDLLGRKLGMKKGRLFMDLLGEIQKTIAEGKTIERTREVAEAVEKALGRAGAVAQHLGKTAMSPEVAVAFANATQFLDVIGDVVMAWMLLWRATLAAKGLENSAGKKDAAFYEGQLKSAEFFAGTVLPVTQGRIAAIFNNCRAVIDIADDSFGGK
jgi:hypothetical protein